jgi:hypothetical protein
VTSAAAATAASHAVARGAVPAAGPDAPIRRSDRHASRAQRLREDSAEPIAPAEPTEKTDAAEPTEKTDAAEPIDPTERTEPTEPTDSTEFRDPIESSESCDHSDHRDLCAAALRSLPGVRTGGG